MTLPDAYQSYPPFRIGEIVVSGQTVTAPGLTIPLAGSQWIVVDKRIAKKRIPAYVIAIAVVAGIMTCGIGFMFLMITETYFEGFVEVSVSYGEKRYMTAVPVTLDKQLWAVYGQVEYAQQLSAHFAA